MPIRDSVGSGGRNITGDVLFVQLLLSDWRSRNDLQSIQIDGLVGPETIEAIKDFQQRFAPVVDGRVDPERETIKALEAFHLEGILSAEERPLVIRYMPVRAPEPAKINKAHQAYLRNLRRALD